MEKSKKTLMQRLTSVSKGNLIFSGILLGFVLVFFIALAIGMGVLNNWLISFEAAQPSTKSQAVFDQLFTDPDWVSLYEISGEQDTVFENSQTYAAHMQSLVAGKDLTFVETSAGLSGDHKYFVKAGDLRIAAFTLTADNKDAQVPDWKLGTLELLCVRNQFCDILVAPGMNITVNGVKLDDSYLIKSITTKAEGNLPAGVEGYKANLYRVDGLMTSPVVSVKDANGQDLSMRYDSTACAYVQIREQAPMTESEKQDLINVAQVYSKYMVLRATTTALKQCIDPSSAFYKTISNLEIWMNKCYGYRFNEAQVYDFYRYSDTLYSARVDMILYALRKDNTENERHLNSTILMQKQGDKWMCINMLNFNVQEQLSTIRLSYMDGDTLLHTDMMDSTVQKLTPPTVTAPEGMEFAGWYTKTVDNSGKTTLSLAFKPDENGTVHLSGDDPLEPMVLYARFVEKES